MKHCFVDYAQWKRLPNARSFAVIKILKTEHFLRDFASSSTSSSKLFGTPHVDYFGSDL